MSKDQARACAVCKGPQILGQMQPTRQLPWLFMQNDSSNNLSYKLYDPVSNKSYVIEGDGFEGKPSFHRSKNGLVLMVSKIAIFLYNPFTMEKIEFPAYEKQYHYFAADYQYLPASGNYVICIMEHQDGYSDSPFCIKTSTSYDQSWTTISSKPNFNFKAGCFFSNFVLKDGMVYCGCYGSGIAIFSIAQNTWSSIAGLPSIANKVTYKSTLVDAGKDILVAVKEQSHHGVNKVFCCKVDSSQNKCIRIKCLGDQTLFWSCAGHVLVPQSSAFVPEGIVEFLNVDINSKLMNLYSLVENKRHRRCNFYKDAPPINHYCWLYSENWMERSWSDLPEELLEIIMSKLVFVDQARVRAVCKRWQTLKPIQPARQVPWLFMQDGTSESLLYKLYDPVSNKTFVIEGNGLVGKLDCLRSKHGLVLMVSKTAVFLFNPFTMEKIEFPAYEKQYRHFAADFEYLPASDNYIICIMEHQYAYNSPFCLKTSSRHDQSWTTISSKPNFDFAAANLLSNFVLKEGMVYCGCYGSGIAIFSIAQNTWSSIAALPPIADKVIYESTLVDAGKDVLVAVKEQSDDSINKVFCCKIDPSQSKFIEVKCLGDQTLFWSRTGHVLVPRATANVPEGVVDFLVTDINIKKMNVYSLIQNKRFQCRNPYVYAPLVRCRHFCWLEPNL